MLLSVLLGVVTSAPYGGPQEAVRRVLLVNVISGNRSFVVVVIGDASVAPGIERAEFVASEPEAVSHIARVDVDSHERQLRVRTRTIFTRIESLRCVLAIGVAVLCKCRPTGQVELGLHRV